jgi:hypothetical protein
MATQSFLTGGSKMRFLLSVKMAQTRPEKTDVFLFIIPQFLDLDSDGDSIPDSQETNGDKDLDGIPNVKTQSFPQATLSMSVSD